MTKHKLDFFIPEKKIVVQEKRKVTVELESKQYIGKKLSQLRKGKKINQLTLSKSIGITRTSLCNIETGRQSLSLKLLEEICIALNCKSTDIIPF